MASAAGLKSGVEQSPNGLDSTSTSQISIPANPGLAMFAAAPAAPPVYATSSSGAQSNGAVGIDPGQVIQQVVYALQGTHAGGQEMRLQLSPPDLGSLHVSVSVHEGVLSARLEAQSPATQQILVDNLSQLKSSLTQQGVAFDRIDVHLAGPQTGSGHSAGMQSSFGRQQGNNSWDQPAALDPLEMDLTPAAKSVSPRSLSRISVTSLDVTV